MNGAVCPSAHGSEANGYIASRPVHAWVTQDNTTSFIKSSSFVLAAGTATLADVEGVEEETPIIRVITTMALGDEVVSIIVLGIDPNSTAARPSLTDGVMLAAQGELVVDRAFARTRDLALGDSVLMQHAAFAWWAPGSFPLRLGHSTLQGDHWQPSISKRSRHGGSRT